MKIKKTQALQVLGKRTLFTSMAAVALMGGATTAVMATTNVNHVKAEQIKTPIVTNNNNATNNEPNTPDKYLGDYTINVKSADFTNVEIGGINGFVKYTTSDGKYEATVSAFKRDGGHIEASIILFGTDNGTEQLQAYVPDWIGIVGTSQRTQLASTLTSGEHHGETGHIFGYINVKLTVDGKATGTLTDALDKTDYLYLGQHHLAGNNNSSSESNNNSSSSNSSSESNTNHNSESTTQPGSSSSSNQQTSSSNSQSSNTTSSSDNNVNSSSHSKPGTSQSSALATAKTNAKQTIDQLGHLTAAQKAQAKAAIDQAGNIANINTIIANAKKGTVGNQETTNSSSQINGATGNQQNNATSSAKLATAKTNAKQAIDQLGHLTAAQKAQAKAAIDQAGNTVNINTIIANAKKGTVAKTTANQPTTLLQTGKSNTGMLIATAMSGMIAIISGAFAFLKRG